uniref:Putative ATPase domain protein n=1 Tax=Trypanosoma vivax (strain Y486) TaxID=1055687 RepID=G0UB35_TRYVY|nr:putative ATPase domain protein [Trypanosoma vivax Y486]
MKNEPVLDLYPSGTVVLLDDVEAVHSLLAMQSVSSRLELLVRRLLNSPGCAFVSSAVDIHHVPQWLLDTRTPITYHVPELTPSAMRRFVLTLPESCAHAACIKGIGEDFLASHLHTRRDLMLFLSHVGFEGSAVPHKDLVALHSSNCTGTPFGQTLPVYRKLFGLGTVMARMDALVGRFFELGGPAGCGTLASLASTTGILLHGPSGSGKTALAMRYGTLYPDRFFSVNCATLFSKYVGESEQRLRDLFHQARHRSPSVLFLDCVDVIGTSRGSFSSVSGSGSGGGVDVTRRMLAALLCELDGLSEVSPVLVVAATTVPDKIDNALLRQGRFETVLHVPPLDFEGAYQMSFDFFRCFRNTEESGELVESLSGLVAKHAEGCTAASLKAFLRVVLERHMDVSGETCTRGDAPYLPDVTLVLQRPSGHESSHSCQV